MKTINIQEKLKLINKQWHPHQIATVNDMQICLAKIEGEFIWHSHDEEDELFLVIKGTLIMQFRDRTETIQEGEMIVIPKQVEHCPITKNGEVHVLLFEKETVKHTGNTEHEKTVNYFPKI